MWKIIAALVPALALGAGPAARATDSPEARAARFLRRYPSLRIIMVEAPGNGHQAAAVGVIKKIRALGYPGPVELDYPESVARKLEYLLPPFSTGPKSQFVPGLDVSTFARDAAPTEGRPPFAIQVGERSVGDHPVDLETVLYLPPPNWSAPTILRHGAKSHPIPRVRPHHPLHLPEPVLGAEPLLSQLAHVPRLAEKMAGLTDLLRARAAGRIDLWTAYGLGFGGVYKTAVLLHVANDAQRERPDLYDRPIVMAMISNLNEVETGRLNEILRDVEVLSIRHAEFESALARAAPGRATLILVGSVSHDLWHYLVNQSTLPPLAAGASGADYLYRLGRPFMLTRDNVLERRRGHSERHLEEELTRVVGALNRRNVSQIARYLIADRDPRSDLRHKFALAAAVARERPDRLCRALLETETLIKLAQSHVPRP